MFLVVKPEVKRDLLLYRPSSTSVEDFHHVIDGLMKSTMLGLEKVEDLSSGDELIAFHQHEVKPSRKQVQPILGTILSSIAPSSSTTTSSSL